MQKVGKYKFWISGLVLISLAFFMQVAGQSTRQELEKKKKQKQLEIQTTQKYLKEIKQRQIQSLMAIQAVNRQIKIRQDIIENLNSQVMSMEDELVFLEDSLKWLEGELGKMKTIYARMIYEGYMNKDHHQALQFLLGAGSFNQAFKRAVYLQQLSLGRKRQLGLLIAAREKVKERQNQIKGIKTEKEGALIEQESEAQGLNQDRDFKKDYLSKLIVDEKQQRSKLIDQERAFKKLNQAIRDIIAKEIEETRKKQQNENESDVKTKGKSVGTTKVFRSVEEEKLSNDFAGNRNRLPWPVDEGFIQSGFGTHSHPTLKNVFVQNNGIDISTNKQTKVKAVFRGTVKAVISIPGMQNSVLISHGDFYTVYCNLEEVLVKNGEVVNVKQVVGIAHWEEGTDRSVVHFEVWKNTHKMNPEDWLGN